MTEQQGALLGFAKSVFCGEQSTNAAQSDETAGEEPTRNSSQMSLNFLTWNVHKCVGRDGRRDPSRVLRVISEIGPDVAVLQEVDRKLGGKRAIFDPEEIFGATGMEVYFCGNIRTGLGWHGNLLLLRRGINCLYMKGLSLPSLEPRGAVLWHLESEGTAFDVIGMHLGLVGAFRSRQVAAVAAEIASRKPVPTIVAGDTNDWMSGSRAMLPLEELLEVACQRPKTFPAGRPILALDRIVAGRGASLSGLGAVHSGLASDHRPLSCKINLPAAA